MAEHLTTSAALERLHEMSNSNLTSIDSVEDVIDNLGLTVNEQREVLNSSSDIVNHPSHYTQGGIECIEAIEASMTPEEYYGYLKGNALKYLWRFENKGNPIIDLQKCRWYLDALIEAMKQSEDEDER